MNVFFTDRAIWHLAFMLGEDLDDLLEGRTTGVRITDRGIAVTDDAVISVEDPEIRLLMWALSHAVFGVKFGKSHHMVGSVIYNQICGFRMKQTKRTDRIIKWLWGTPRAGV